jgi:hypothetical protein
MDDNDGIAIRSVDDIARDGGVMLQHHLHARVRLHGLRLLCLLWSQGGYHRGLGLRLLQRKQPGLFSHRIGEFQSRTNQFILLFLDLRHGLSHGRLLWRSAVDHRGLVLLHSLHAFRLAVRACGYWRLTIHRGRRGFVNLGGSGFAVSRQAEVLRRSSPEIQRSMMNSVKASPFCGGNSDAPDPAGWTRLEKTWVGIVALLFSSTGSLKLYGGLAGPWRLDTNERVFDLPMSDWSLAAGTLELVWVAILISSPGPGVGLLIIRFLFGAILAYRGLLNAFGGGYCGCLGGLLSETPWQSHEGLVLGSLAVLGLAVNEGYLALRRRRHRPGAQAAITNGPQVGPGAKPRTDGHLEPDLWA